MEEEKIEWASPVAHLIEDMIREYNDYIAIEDMNKVKYAQLVLEIAYRQKEANQLRAEYAAFLEGGE